MIDAEIKEHLDALDNEINRLFGLLGQDSAPACPRTAAGTPRQLRRRCLRSRRRPHDGQAIDGAAIKNGAFSVARSRRRRRDRRDQQRHALRQHQWWIRGSVSAECRQPTSSICRSLPQGRLGRLMGFCHGARDLQNQERLRLSGQCLGRIRQREAVWGFPADQYRVNAAKTLCRQIARMRG